MSYTTVEVDIEHGRVVPREPDKLPEHGNGLLTILPSNDMCVTLTKPVRKRVELPLIRGDGKNIINPARKDLDASLWGD